MSKYSKEFILKQRKFETFPNKLVEKDCIYYKDLLFENEINTSKLNENDSKNIIKLSESFFIEKSNENKEEEKSFKRSWINNKTNQNDTKKKMGILKIFYFNFSHVLKKPYIYFI